MRYQWVLFDADGTLFDYDRAEASALEKTFAQFDHAFAPGHIQAYRQINARIWQDFEKGKIAQARLKVRRFELLLEAIDIEPAPDPATFSASYLKHLGGCAHLVAGAKEIVESLSGKVRLALITNGLREVQRSRLAKSPIGDHFRAVVISDEVGVAKPDRAIFDIAFSRMDRPRKEHVLIVGDSLTSDIKGGADYGIDTCWFNPMRKPRDLDVEIQYEISDLCELLDVVGVARSTAERKSGQRGHSWQ